MFAAAVVLILAAAAPAIAGSIGSTTTVELTGYSHHDNHGGDNADICCGVVHRFAVGTGTYGDPITVAVPGSHERLETPARTRTYLSAIRKYVIVEDSGASRENRRHLDIYVDGAGLATSAAKRCMNRITDTTRAILNPPRAGARWPDHHRARLQPVDGQGAARG